MYHEDRIFYGIYDSKAKLFWDQGCSSEMSWFKHDPHFEPNFIERCPSGGMYDLKRTESLWRIYEFQRTQYRPEWPKTTIRKFVPRMRIEDAGFVRAILDPNWTMIQKMRAKHGNVMADALQKLAPEAQPVYSIKRKGKTQGLVKEVLPDTILHEGMFMFFYDDHDITLAKIALGANISYEYDLTPFHVC
jgi:hypothetical protein